ncbi:hypothetical protein BH11BAC6_BH11BAC6_12900 [soil metagenome]
MLLTFIFLQAISFIASPVVLLTCTVETSMSYPVSAISKAIEC